MLLFSNPGLASDSQSENKQPEIIHAQTDIIGESEDEKKSTSQPKTHKVDSFHAALSRSISGSADWIDSFFGEERSEIEEEDSSLRLKFSGLKETGEAVDYKVKARLHLVLPNLERKLHLFASSILEEDENDVEYLDPDGAEYDRRRSLYLSMRYFIETAENMNLSLRAGLKIRSLTPAVFAGPRYSYITKWGSWNFRFIEDLTYFTDNGWESNCTFDFEKSFTETVFYRIKYTGKWQDKEPGYVYWVDNDLYHTISDNKAVNYRVRALFDRHPGNQLTYVLTAIRYRKGFYRKWLFYEISPQVVFRKEKDFHPSPGITLSLEFLLGEDFMHMQ